MDAGLTQSVEVNKEILTRRMHNLGMVYLSYQDLTEGRAMGAAHSHTMLLLSFVLLVSKDFIVGQLSFHFELRAKTKRTGSTQMVFSLQLCELEDALLSVAPVQR